MNKNRLLIKIRNLSHQLEYLKKVYPRCSKIKTIENEIIEHKKMLITM